MKILFILLNFICFGNPQELSKDVFYAVLSATNVEEVSALIIQLEKKERNAKERAYLATLYMKKANFIKDLKLKISTFKKGASLLELEIKNNDSFENRFLRFVIQENTPKILKYNLNLEEDKRFLINDFKKQSNILKKHVLNYSKVSIILDFTE